MSSSTFSCDRAISLQVSRSTLACSGEVLGLVQEFVVENHEQPASRAASIIETSRRIGLSIEIRRYLAGIAAKLQLACELGFRRGLGLHALDRTAGLPPRGEAAFEVRHVLQSHVLRGLGRER